MKALATAGANKNPWQCARSFGLALLPGSNRHLLPSSCHAVCPGVRRHQALLRNRCRSLDCWPHHIHHQPFSWLFRSQGVQQGMPAVLPCTAIALMPYCLTSSQASSGRIHIWRGCLHGWTTNAGPSAGFALHRGMTTYDCIVCNRASCQTVAVTMYHLHYMHKSAGVSGTSVSGVGLKLWLGLMPSPHTFEQAQRPTRHARCGMHGIMPAKHQNLLDVHGCHVFRVPAAFEGVYNKYHAA